VPGDRCRDDGGRGARSACRGFETLAAASGGDGPRGGGGAAVTELGGRAPTRLTGTTSDHAESAPVGGGKGLRTQDWKEGEKEHGGDSSKMMNGRAGRWRRKKRETAR